MRGSQSAKTDRRWNGFIPGLIGTNIAPRREQPNSMATISRRLGHWTSTRSPADTPCAASHPLKAWLSLARRAYVQLSAGSRIARAPGAVAAA